MSARTVGVLLLLVMLPAFLSVSGPASLFVSGQGGSSSAAASATTPLDFARIKSDVSLFSSIPSRFTGYPGSYEAAQIILDRFKSLHLDSVFTINYTTTVPLDEGSYVRVGDRNFTAYSLYPNVVAYGEGVTKGRLVYVGDGSLASIKGIDLNGTIALMSFNSGDNWLNVVNLGAKAVVFYGGNNSGVSEALAKVTNVPLNIPRLYVQDAEAQELIALASTGAEAEVDVGMKWENVLGINVIGEIKGSEDPSKLIMIMAHYDSASVVPALSPGAEDSIGLATMLEFARILASDRPRYTVWFVAVSGHWQASAGSRALVEDFLFGDPRVGTELFPYLAFCIDLSSGSTTPNLVMTDMLYHTNTALVGQKLNDMRLLMMQEVINKLPADLKSKIWSTELGSLRGLSYDSTGGSYGYQSAMSFRYVLDQDPFCAAGMLGVAAITINDMRPRAFSLSDTADRVDMDNAVLPQVRFVDMVIRVIMGSDITKIFSGDWSQLKPTRFGQYNTGIAFLHLIIQTVKYNPLIASLYTTVPDALVVMYEVNAPFYRYVYESNSTGETVIDGLIPSIGSMAGARYNVFAYKIDAEGRIIFAPDDGPNGAGGVFPTAIRVIEDNQVSRTVLFECGSVVAFDVVSPATLQATNARDSLYNARNAYSQVAFQYAGYECPMTLSITPFKIIGYAPPDSWGFQYDPDMGVAVTYVPPGIALGLIIKATSLTKPVGLFINATPTNPDGSGFVLPVAGDVLFMADGLIGQCSDLIDVALARYGAQAAKGVLDPTTTQNVQSTIYYGGTVDSMLGSEDYAGAFANGLLTWGFGQAAYSASLGALRDSVTSVIIAFALAIPFVVLFSALAYGLTRGSRSMVFTAAVAIVVALVLSICHPGFALAANVPAIFMGIVVIALILPALFFLFANFSTALSELRRTVFGAHFLERSGFEVSFSAISIGLGNMRKRPLRTVLTLSSIVLVAFALSSLTSVTTMRVVNVVESTTTVQYNGLLVHTPSFFPMDRNSLLDVATFLGAQDMSERYWVYLPGSPSQGMPTAIRVRSCSNTSRYADISALAGISPLEVKATFANSSQFIVQGSMFADDNEYSCLLSTGLASFLGVSTNDTIYVDGCTLRVAGIYDAAKMTPLVKDSDGYADLVPVDYSRMTLEQRFDLTFFSFNDIILIPSGIARQFPEASLTSIFIPLKGQSVESALDKVKTVFTAFEGIDFYLTWNGKVYLFSKQNAQSMFGIQFLVVPLVMAGLVTMSTVLGGVMERLREAGIYSSLGLAPMQVGLMFLTENVVYAIVGGMLGYLGGMSVSFAFKQLGILGGLVTNYTSMSVAIAIGTIIVLVLLASIYPMYRVALIVTPSLERRWRIETKPKGDVWDIPIPFRVKDEEKAMGIAVFLREYLWSKRIERAENFTVEEVSAKREDSALVLRSRVWLPPYEENIRHDVQITILKSKTELRYLIDMKMKRVSGAYESWVKFSYPFVDEVRKQLLVWSLLTPAQAEKYTKLARQEFGSGEQ